MCYSEQIRYPCGHSSLPIVRPCPMTTQLHTAPICEMKGSITYEAETMCTACERILHSRWVLIEEWEHRFYHQRGACDCGVHFPDLLTAPHAITGAGHIIDPDATPRARPRAIMGPDHFEDSDLSGAEASFLSEMTATTLIKEEITTDAETTDAESSPESKGSQSSTPKNDTTDYESSPEMGRGENKGKSKAMDVPCIVSTPIREKKSANVAPKAATSTADKSSSNAAEASSSKDVDTQVAPLDMHSSPLGPPISTAVRKSSLNVNAKPFEVASSATAANTDMVPALYEEKKIADNKVAVTVRQASLYAAEWVCDHRAVHASGRCNCGIDPSTVRRPVGGGPPLTHQEADLLRLHRAAVVGNAMSEAEIEDLRQRTGVPELGTTPNWAVSYTEPPRPQVSYPLVLGKNRYMADERTIVYDAARYRQLMIDADPDPTVKERDRERLQELQVRDVTDHRGPGRLLNAYNPPPAAPSFGNGRRDMSSHHGFAHAYTGFPPAIRSNIGLGNDIGPSSGGFVTGFPPAVRSNVGLGNDLGPHSGGFGSGLAPPPDHHGFGRRFVSNDVRNTGLGAGPPVPQRRFVSNDVRNPEGSHFIPAPRNFTSHPPPSRFNNNEHARAPSHSGGFGNNEGYALHTYDGFMPGLYPPPMFEPGHPLHPPMFEPGPPFHPPMFMPGHSMPPNPYMTTENNTVPHYQYDAPSPPMFRGATWQSMPPPPATPELQRPGRHDRGSNRDKPFYRKPSHVTPNANAGLPPKFPKHLPSGTSSTQHVDQTGDNRKHNSPCSSVGSATPKAKKQTGDNSNPPGRFYTPKLRSPTAGWISKSDPPASAAKSDGSASTEKFVGAAQTPAPLLGTLTPKSAHGKSKSMDTGTASSKVPDTESSILDAKKAVDALAANWEFATKDEEGSVPASSSKGKEVEPSSTTPSAQSIVPTEKHADDDAADDTAVPKNTTATGTPTAVSKGKAVDTSYNSPMGQFRAPSNVKNNFPIPTTTGPKPRASSNWHPKVKTATDPAKGGNSTSGSGTDAATSLAPRRHTKRGGKSREKRQYWKDRRGYNNNFQIDEQGESSSSAASTVVPSSSTDLRLPARPDRPRPALPLRPANRAVTTPLPLLGLPIGAGPEGTRLHMRDFETCQLAKQRASDADSEDKDDNASSSSPSA